MGFYLRKALSVGPFRLNLSRSGLGASFGVKGARIGLGRRGSYIHVGRGGLYYRQSLGGGRPHHSPSQSLETELLTEVESGDVSQMVDGTSSDLLAELNRIHKRHSVFPITFILLIAP